MSTRKRRSYTAEFKLEAIKLITEHGYSFSEAAEKLGIGDQLLRNWMAKFDHEGEEAFLKGLRKGTPLNGNGAELRRLREDNRQLRAECEVLKKAAAVFAKDLH